MKFCEKLTFLLNITNTSNLELANAIHVKPSIISLYKNDKRPMPKKESILINISQFFSVKIQNDYQKQALAQKIGNYSFIRYEDPELLTNEIYSWFKNIESDQSSALDIIQNIQDNNTSFNANMNTYIKNSSVDINATCLDSFLDKIDAIENPQTLYVHFDDNIFWYFDSKYLVTKFRNTINSMLAKGCRIVHFLPPSTNRYFEYIFNEWIPFYLSGKVEAYYYPRLKDNTFRNHILVLDDVVSLFSISIYNQKTPGFSSISNNKSVNDSLRILLEDYKEICEPAFQLLKDEKNTRQKIQETLLESEEIMFVRDNLPFELLPSEQLKYFSDDQSNPSIVYYHDLMKQKQNIHMIDFCPLYSKMDILTHKAKIHYFDFNPGSTIEYTIPLYCHHLENIIEEMKSNSHYLFIPSSKRQKTYPMIISKRKKALLIRNDEQKYIFEILQPELVNTIEEYLNQEIDRIPYQGSLKNHMISYLEHYVEKLKKE